MIDFIIFNWSPVNLWSSHNITQ